MKKMTLMTLCIVALASFAGCATTENTGSVAKTETTPQAVDTKAETPKVMDTQKSETPPPAIGKRGLKLPHAASDKPADKASLCTVDENGEVVCR